MRTAGLKGHRPHTNKLYCMNATFGIHDPGRCSRMMLRDRRRAVSFAWLIGLFVIVAAEVFPLDLSIGQLGQSLESPGYLAGTCCNETRSGRMIDSDDLSS